MLEDLYHELEVVEEKLTDSFSEILNYEELSYYKGVLIALKINLFQLKQYEIGIEINNMDLKINRSNKKFNIFKILCYLFSILILFTNCWPFGIILMIQNFCNSKLVKDNLSTSQNIFNKSRELFDKCDRIAQNCQTFINKKMTVGDERFNEQINNKEVIDLEPNYYAQNLIDLYISFDKLMDTTPEIQDIVVKMLQNDLCTTESDFMTLLNMAKEKLSEEKIIEKSQESDDLCQKYDESCRKLQKFYNKKRKSGGKR